MKYGKNLFLHCLAILALLTFAGCEVEQLSGGGVGGSGSGDSQYADGGTGGSGSGSTSGYGSIIVNDGRHYQIHPDAHIRLDGEVVPPETVDDEGKGLPLGVTLEFSLGEFDANSEYTQPGDDLQEGTAVAIEARHNVIGPVTGTQPLEVLDQKVLVTSDTHLAGFKGGEPGDLEAGSVVKVAGYRGPTGLLRATRLAVTDHDPEYWQLIGRVAEADDSGFKINGQRVEINGVALEDCPAPVEPASLEEGTQVMVRAYRDTEFDGVITSTEEIRCLPEGLSLFGKEPPEQVPAAVEAIITGLEEQEGLFTLNLDGQKVKVDPEDLLDIVFGTLEDLRLGGRIEVEGTLEITEDPSVPGGYDTVLHAEKIRLRDPLVDLTAPLTGGLPGQVLEMLGVAVSLAPDLDDPDGLGQQILSQGLDEDVQARTLGFLDSAGVLHAELIEDEGPPNPDLVSVNALITEIDPDQGLMFLATVPMDPETADSVLLETVDGVVDVLLDTTCLVGICLESTEDDEVLGELEPGMRGRLSDSSFDDVELIGGDLVFEASE